MAVRVPIIAIVGRPNVGKSTLFNRIVGERRAVVEDTPGVTRDRNYSMVERYEIPICVVDTGGFEAESEDELQRMTSEQAVLAAEEADGVIAVFDGAVGVQPADEEMVSLLRRYRKPILYVVNKCDGKEQALRAGEFYSLGIEDIRDMSALNGRNVTALIEEFLCTLPNYSALLASAKQKRANAEAAEDAARHELEAEGDVLEEADEERDEVLEQVEESEPEFAPVFIPDESDISEVEYDRAHRVRSPEAKTVTEGISENECNSPRELEPKLDGPIRVAIVGRPNVGKSTLLNTLTGEQRALTSEIAGTTRDSIDVSITRDGQEYVIVDTAGLRRKPRIHDKIERYSTLRALRVLSECDVAVVIIDALQGPTEQDARIVGLAHDQGRGLVVAVNKWDLLDKDHKTVKDYTEQIKECLRFAPYGEIVFVSAKSGKRCPRIIEAVKKAALQRLRWVGTGELNRVLGRAVKRKSARASRGRPLKLFFGSQVDTAPPRFALFFNYPKDIHFSYIRYLKNAIRDEFGFEGTDIKLMTRKR